ncbi:Methylthioribose-1-phosphate isomerase [Desulfurobacterium thermolithotrophum DSM 11699]|uniref:Methylthioribose-1-phosphate isomerase n=1 Tax=Desulfurobacterium thermolithotrophum (strain DSM 11699 / BSA) TaxID=868864 RepID=F0S1G0_DESTD|nr:S-methyl-5-thioribose-1-phosphate isomerase [Desulfurobacterium thermolithotrophum]ADY73963.1 Methylthioribose-1-phosphate isomerase [Desulfurobacterium thermolithotrophum DSM 11699]
MGRIKDIRPLKWTGESLLLIDQRKLPLKEEWIECKDYESVAKAIEDMVVRGAPAIGVVAAYGVAIGAKQVMKESKNFIDFKAKIENVINRLASTRPTAVNLFWALKKMKKILEAGTNEKDIVAALETEAINIEKQDVETNKKIGYFGAELLGSKEVILTHCNTGALATAGYGTALGVIRAAVETGRDILVYVDETRPYLQGARLTAWELQQEDIPYYLITDNMAGYFMSRGEITCIIVGADRIASNGDTANKIGTYSLSVLAKEHGIPFYVAAPTSTFDLTLKSGKEIPIEERSPDEVLFCHCKDCRIAPYNAKVRNPAFDVTPHENITGIITEKGVINSPDEEKILEFFSK